RPRPARLALQLHRDRQGPTRVGHEPPGRHADGHRPVPRRHDGLPADVPGGRRRRHARRAHHERRLLLRLLAGHQGLRRRDPRGLRQLPARHRRRAVHGPRRVVQRLLRQRLPWGARLRPDPARALLAERGHARPRGRRVRVFVPLAVAYLALPALLPPFQMTVLGFALIATMVVYGINLITGRAGITSLGQAAFMGFGAYATAIVSSRLGLSPWLGLLAALLLATAMAAVLGALTVR